MKPAPFSYVTASSSEGAVAALAEGSSRRVIAGGQSLAPMLNLRIASVDALIDVAKVPQLREIQELPASIRYGAMTTHAAFEDRKVPDGSNGLMPHVAANIAFRAIRTRGTIGGALALADPAADWVTAVIALEGTLHLLSKSGRRSISAEQFVLGAYYTALQDGELIEAVEVPKRRATERWGYYKVAPKIGEYAKSLAITLINRDRKTARVVLGAVDGAPIVLSEAMRAIAEGCGREELADIVRKELIATQRNFSTARFVLHSNTVLRSIEDAQK